MLYAFGRCGKDPPEIALDEAGNTGSKLLDSQQPVFVLASVSLSCGQADNILEGIRTAQTKKLKFSRLQKSEPGRHRIIKFLASPDLNADNTKAYFVHKKFMVVAKIVDVLIVESLRREIGFDAYKDGANIVLNNLHFHCMPTFCGEDWTDTLHRRFVEMMRQPTPKSVQGFYSAARALYEMSSNRDYAALLLPLLESERIIEGILASSNKNSLDPAIPAFIAHCVNWRERFGDAFSLMHDDSKPIFQEKTALEDFFLPRRGGA